MLCTSGYNLKHNEKKQNNLPCAGKVLVFVDDPQGRTGCSEKGLDFTFPLPISIFLDGMFQMNLSTFVLSTKHEFKMPAG